MCRGILAGVTWDDWMIEQTRMLTSLRGRGIERWDGVELALWDNDSDIPRFSDATFPFLHLFSLRAAMTDGAALTITTYQEDANFGLRSFPDARFDDQRWEGIYRWRALPELPVGPVDQVAVFADEDVVAEMDLRIGGQPLLLVAGELDGAPDDELLLHRLDDAVLAFTDLAAAENAPWSSPRRDLRPIPSQLP